MIDLLLEDLVEVGDARKYLPGQPDRRTVYRFLAGQGTGGVTLESVKCGGKRFTSRQAIVRFIAAQNQRRETAPTAETVPRERSPQQEQLAAPVARLAAAGIIPTKNPRRGGHTAGLTQAPRSPQGTKGPDL
jgi:Protein of unknown function (DUF1580)